MTSDEQRERAAFEARFEGKLPLSHLGPPGSQIRYLYSDTEWAWFGWQACAAQQAPQARADERPLPKVNIAIVYRFLGTEKRAAIYSTNWKDGIDINVPAYGLQALVEFYVAQDRVHALAANPQQSNESGDNQLRREVAAKSPAVNGPGSAPASLSPNPQIASEPKENE